MGFKEQQDAIQRELDKFIDMLGKVLPHYSKLLKRSDLSTDELKELGEIEHFLIGVNGRISEIRQMLEEDVFGHSLHYYYQLKEKVKLGEPGAQQKLERLRDTFNESLHGGTFIHWN